MQKLILVYILSITSFSAYALNVYGLRSKSYKSASLSESERFDSNSYEQKPKIKDITQEIIRDNIRLFFFAKPILVVEIEHENKTIYSSLGGARYPKSEFSNSDYSYKTFLTMFGLITKNTNQSLEFVRDSDIPHIKLSEFSRNKQSVHLFVLTKNKTLYEIKVMGNNLSANEIDKYLKMKLEAVRVTMAGSSDSPLAH